MSDQQRYSRRKQAQLALIGTVPAVKNPPRRLACRLDLHRFLRTYYPHSTGLSPFGPDQKRMIARIETCILDGGRFANVIFRGGCKTSISEGAATWGGLFGHRRFLVVFGSDDRSASEIVDSIKSELLENDLLYEDFPEAIHAIRHLENRPQRCYTQAHLPGDVEGYQPDAEAEPLLTHVEWTGGKISLPRIMLPDGLAVSSGIAIVARGLTGSFLGMAHKRFDGVKQRPDLILLDDVQTPETAATDLQVTKRLKTITNGILKLGGHNRRLAVVMNATPLAYDDLVERLCDPVRNPSWQSERSPMVKAMPDALESHWLGEYARLRNSYDRQAVGDQERAHRAATTFYRRNKRIMDSGCVISWKHCFDRETEISAVQHAMNILIDDGRESFDSQCQCEPVKPQLGEINEMDAHEIASKINRLPVGVLPLKTSHVTAFIDVQASLLYWLVAAWSDDFSGAIVRYGAFPEQGIKNFALRDARKTLAMVCPGAGPEGAIHAGLKSLTDQLLKIEWQREDGTLLRIERCLVDSGFQPEVVHQVCAASQYAGVLLPSKGFAIGAKSLPFGEFRPKPGERFGQNWLISPSAGGRRLAKYDTNFWKSFLHARLATAIGDRGSLNLYGTDPHEHAMLASHLHAEYRVRTEGRGRQVDEWLKRPNAGDNHLFDCAVGAACAASMLGCSILDTTTRPKRKPRIPLSEMGRR